MALAYFAGDGNYGLENGNFALINIDKWTDEDWDKIESALDWERPTIAYKISEEKENTP